jgi:hypothetical protein
LRQAVIRSSATSVRKPLAASQEDLAEYPRAKRFVWAKSADMILATIEGCRGT